MFGRIFRNPKTWGAVILLAAGLIMAAAYDPAEYEHRPIPYTMTDPLRRAEIALENERRDEERERYLIITFGLFGFGLLSLASATWDAARERRAEAERKPADPGEPPPPIG